MGNTAHPTINTFQLGSVDLGNVTNGNYWFMGISEDARLIKKHTLDIDFTLTGMNFQLDSGTGITGDKPGVIRVYQEGYAESAAIFSVTGTYYSTAAFNVDIKGDLGARIVVIDAWDPASNGPNNVCSFAGTITLMGKPIITADGGSSQGGGGGYAGGGGNMAG